MTPFVELLASLGADPQEAGSYFALEVAPRYAEKHRHYHTLLHIYACLTVLDESPVLGVSNVGPKKRAVELALWFHDLVYTPQERGNEEASAELLRKCRDELGLDASIVDFAVGAILWTTHRKQPDWYLTIPRTVVDVDLSILGAPEDVFDEYERQVREEYAFVPDNLWIPGRTDVLETFRKRERIYTSPEYVARFEEPARANLARSLRRLERGEVLRLEKKM